MTVPDFAEGLGNILAGFVVVAAVLAFAAWLAGPLTAGELLRLAFYCLAAWLVCTIYRKARS